MRISDLVLHFCDTHRKLLLAGLMFLYLLSLNGQWHIEPDSALYLTIARNLALGRGYTYHGLPHHLAYPGLPWLIAGTFRIFGVGVLWPAHVLMLLCGIGAVFLTYRLFHLHADRATATVITCLYGVSELALRYSIELRNDMPFLLGVLAALVGYEAAARYLESRQRHNLTGVDPESTAASIDAPATDAPSPRATPRTIDLVLLPIGLAITYVMRPTMWVFIPLVVLAFLWQVTRRRRWLQLSLVAALAIAVIIIFFTLRNGDYEDDMVGIFTSSARLSTTMSRSWNEYIPQIIRSVPAAAFGHEVWRMNVFACVVLLGLGAALARRRPLWGLWVAACTGMLLITLPRDRYFLPVLPLLACGWWFGIRWLNQRLPGRAGNFVCIVMLALWVCPNFVRACNGVFQQRRTPFLASYKSGRFPALIQLSGAIKQATAENAIILSPNKWGRILTYFSDRNVLVMREVNPADLNSHPLYAVLPDDASSETEDERHDFDAALEPLPFTVGPAIVTIPRSEKSPRSPKPSLTPWTLHLLTPLPPTTAPSTAP
ncbi:MAG TPA: glycosyltransferase family 39 protein [Tepidisphaeraceae bacterium]